MEFRELWSYLDQWKVLFELHQKELPITEDRFQTILTEMGFNYSPELSVQIFARFSQNEIAILFDQFVHSIVVLQD